MSKSTFLKCLVWLTSFLLLAVGACTPTGRLVPDEEGEHHCAFRIVGGVIPFDGGTKAGGVFTPSKENRVYVRMIGAAGPVLGQATYDEEAESWSFTYNGSLAGATSGEAHAVLFEKNIQSETSMGLNLRYCTPIYEDKNASFSIDENGIILHASLAPKTGRITLTHDLEEGQSRSFERVGGISCYYYFELSTFSFLSQDLCTESVYLSRSESGNGEYIYGFFTDEDNPQIMLQYYEKNVGTFYYYKYLPQNALRQGASGYVDIPTVNSAGWRKY